MLETPGGIAKRDGLWNLIHPDIERVCRSRYESGHYGDAVEAAFKQVNVAVKAAVKTALGEELDGAPLMYKAFSPSKPVIHLSDLSTESGQNVQQGYMQIYAGAMIGIRNPQAHENREIDEWRASHLLILASHLMSTLDEAV